MRIPMQRTGGSATATPVRDDHAVVLGASMAGLLATRVLADHFAQVTIVERDQLPQRATPRPGVPQGRHIHLVLPRGSMAMEELFPGLLRELVEAGAPVLNSLAQVHFETNGHVLFHDPDGPGVTRPAADGMAYEPSRPLLEATVRARVLALPNVDLLEESDVAGLTTNPSLSVLPALVPSPRRAAAGSSRSMDMEGTTRLSTARRGCQRLTGSCPATWRRACGRRSLSRTCTSIASRPTCGGGTSSSTGFPRVCWSVATRCAASTRSTGKA